MKRIILTAVLALAACTGEPAADNRANEMDANTLPPVAPVEPANAVVDEAAPAANVGDHNQAVEKTEGRARPDRARPYQPVPDAPPPRPEPEPDPHAGHDMGNMSHDPPG